MATRKRQRAEGRDGDASAPGASGTPGPLRIRKYANRRLYDQTASRHLTNEELYRLVASGHDVVIVDARTEEEITNVVLAQLLIERDPLKLAAVPPALLHALIRTNERMLHSAISRHLTGMVESMAQLQRQAHGAFSPGANPALPGPFPNPLAAFAPAASTAALSAEWMRRMFGVPTPISSESEAEASSGGDRAEAAAPSPPIGETAELRAKLERLERQLDALVQDRRNDLGASDGEDAHDRPKSRRSSASRKKSR